MQPPDKRAEIEAMMWGRLLDLLVARYGPIDGDFRPLMKVTRADLELYLQCEPDEARRYFAENSSMPVVHESSVIRKIGSSYGVSVSDHGVLRGERRFHDLASAVAKHVLIRHGMY